MLRFIKIESRLMRIESDSKWAWRIFLKLLNVLTLNCDLWYSSAKLLMSLNCTLKMGKFYCIKTELNKVVIIAFPYALYKILELSNTIQIWCHTEKNNIYFKKYSLSTMRIKSWIILFNHSKIHIKYCSILVTVLVIRETWWRR